MENICLSYEGVKFSLEPHEAKNVERNTNSIEESIMRVRRKRKNPEQEMIVVELNNFCGTLCISKELASDILLNEMSQNSRRPTPSPPSTPLTIHEKNDESFELNRDYVTPKRANQAPISSLERKPKTEDSTVRCLKSPENIRIDIQNGSDSQALTTLGQMEQSPTTDATNSDLEYPNQNASSKQNESQTEIPSSIVEEDNQLLSSSATETCTFSPLTRKMVDPPCARWGQTLTKIDNSRVLLYGGQTIQNDEFEILSDVYIYDTKDRTWGKPITNNQKPRCWHSSNFVPERKLLITFSGEKDKDTEHVMVLDTDIMLWYPPVMSGNITPLAGRSGHSSSYMPCADMIIVFGGVKKKWLNTITVLDIKRWRWSQPRVIGNPPPPRSYHSAVVLDSKRIVIFGGNNENQSFNSVYVLDWDGNNFTWFHPQVSGEVPAARTGHCAVLLDNKKLLIHGGWDPNEDECMFNDCFVLDTNNWNWKEVKGLLPEKRVGHSVVYLQEEKELLYFGGRLPDDKFSNELCYCRAPL